MEETSQFSLLFPIPGHLVAELDSQSYIFLELNVTYLHTLATTSPCSLLAQWFWSFGASLWYMCCHGPYDSCRRALAHLLASMSCCVELAGLFLVILRHLRFTTIQSRCLLDRDASEERGWTER